MSQNKLVISCMDLRMVKHLTNAMDHKGQKDKYDLVCVAGGGLCVGMRERKHLSKKCQCMLSAWNQTVMSHVDLAQKLHNVNEVWFVDHEDCGAYSHFFHNKDLKEEAQHIDVLQNIPEKFPNVKVRLFWMKLDGELFELVNTTSNHFSFIQT